ncbi:MAG: histidine kinase, partial [Tunicatimonas sp.]
SFLRQQRYGWYALGFLLCVLLSSALTTLSYQAMYYAVNGNWNIAEGWFRGSTYPQFLGITVMMGFTAVVFVMIVKLTKDWLKDQRHTQQLEKEKLETELKFLRSQFNPHFLFNTINSIHFLIQKDPELASDTLAKFSDLLRYQLYECNEARIPVKKEVHYLSNFVALEKLRNSERLSVTLDVSENVNGAQVAPFILMPFVENAFKHASKGKQQDNFIRVALRQSPQQLQFDVENSKEAGPAVTQEAVHYGGIGLVNVRRRLDLLYPQRHTLRVDERDRTYAVHLTLDLDEN